MPNPFRINSHTWHMQREGRPISVFVVEPREYAPASHAAILNGALGSLIGGNVVEAYDPSISLSRTHQHFDLLTFPEAFLAAADFVTALETLVNAGPTGCIHAGLRPAIQQPFLFSVEQTYQLLRDLRGIGVTDADLNAFYLWLIDQKPDGYFNLGAVFGVDVSGAPRVCLHAKMVRSKYEISALTADHMVESNLLTVLTIVPSNSRLLPFTLQPLLCSDALMHDTDLPGGRPLDALTTYGSMFSPPAPDHVDIVSLATCTPHHLDVQFPRWHQAFRDAFLRAAKDDATLRHRHALFVLSNFIELPEQRTGGLSGAYLPTAIKNSILPNYVTSALFGALHQYDDPIWHSGDVSLKQSIAHMICLKSDELKRRPAASMLGFDIHRLARECNQHNRYEGLVGLKRYFGVVQKNGTVHFTRD